MLQALESSWVGVVVGVALLPLLGWFAGRLMREIDGKADRSELAALIEQVKRQNDAGEKSREHVWSKLDELGRAVIGCREGIARIEGPRR